MQNEHFIAGKDASLEHSITTMQGKLAALGFVVEERSWLNPVDNVWSVHVRNRDCHLMFTNGKGATRLAAQASALGEFFERLSCNYFWNHYYLGQACATGGYYGVKAEVFDHMGHCLMLERDWEIVAQRILRWLSSLQL